MGRIPRQLVKLHYLLDGNPSLTDTELAAELGVEPETIRCYRWRLRNLQQDVAKFCPKCLRPTVFLDEEAGERVCRSCGLVIESVPRLSDDLPFGEAYALTSNLAFGRSLGDTLPARQLFKVIAKAPEGTRDLPIRSTQIRVISSALDPPIAKNMLGYGSRMLKSLGLDRDTEECHVLADLLGALLRRLAAFIQIARLKGVQPHLVVRAAVYHLLTQLYPEKAEEVRGQFPFREEVLVFVEKLTRLLPASKGAATQCRECEAWIKNRGGDLGFCSYYGIVTGDHEACIVNHLDKIHKRRVNSRP